MANQLQLRSIYPKQQSTVVPVGAAMSLKHLSLDFSGKSLFLIQREYSSAVCTSCILAEIGRSVPPHRRWHCSRFLWRPCCAFVSCWDQLAQPLYRLSSLPLDVLIWVRVQPLHSLEDPVLDLPEPEAWLQQRGASNTAATGQISGQHNMD